jgi:hypothetical protein
MYLGLLTSDQSAANVAASREIEAEQRISQQNLTINT